LKELSSYYIVRLKFKKTSIGVKKFSCIFFIKERKMDKIKTVLTSLSLETQIKIPYKNEISYLCFHNIFIIEFRIVKEVKNCYWKEYVHTNLKSTIKQLA